MPTTLHENRPSAGIGVVEVQKPMGFLRFLRCSRDPLRGSAWSRCKNPWCFAISKVRDPLRRSAWSRCKNQWFFCDFCGARATLCGNRRGRGAKTPGFLRLLLFELVLGSCLVVRAPAPGTGGSRVRFLPGARTCAEQLAQSKLHRATCADQLAPTSLRRAPCLEQLAQSNLHRATCAEQLAQSNLQGAQFAQSNLQGATCRDQLAGATCAEQLAQTNLHRPVCAEHLAWCCLALASQMPRGGKKNASCSVGPTSLAMLCFRASRGLVSLCAPRGGKTRS